jgi:hypothetical protein
MLCDMLVMNPTSAALVDIRIQGSEGLKWTGGSCFRGHRRKFRSSQFAYSDDSITKTYPNAIRSSRREQHFLLYTQGGE